MNLIVTCARHFEDNAKEEIKTILVKQNCQDISITQTDMSGILVIDADIDPIILVKKIYNEFEDEPWSIRYCLRIIPVHTSVCTKLDQITSAVKILVKNLDEKLKYRITIEKREHDISTKEIISRIAQCTNNKVSLTKPDIIILVEILKDLTGISLVKPDEIFSLDKARRALTE